MCCVLFAPTERKSPTAGLQPGSPQNLSPSHLVLSSVSIRASLLRLFLFERVFMSLHSFGGPLEDFCIPRLRLRSQSAGLWGVRVKVKQQRRVVVRHMFSMTQTHHGVVASTSSRGREIGSEKVHLKDGVTWKEIHTSEEEGWCNDVPEKFWVTETSFGGTNKQTFYSHQNMSNLGKA